MDVSVIYVNYKTGKFILDSIESLKKHTRDISYEIIVVDNHSEDGSAEQIRKAYPQVILIDAGENIGFGRGNNLGIEVAKGKMIFFLNPDTLFVNNAIKILAAHLEKEGCVGACGGNLVDENGTPTISFGRRFPSFYEEFLSIFYLKPWFYNYPKSVSYNYTGKIMKVASIVGADLMVKRSILDKTGYFSPDFFMNFEETELCYRIRKAGYEIVSVPDAKIIHFTGRSSYVNVSRIQRFLEGKYVFFLKKYGIAGVNCLYALTIWKCILRKLQFTLLANGKKKSYWHMKSETNKNVFKTLFNKKS